MPTQITALTGVVAIAPAQRFTVALKSDGTVWGWGRNTRGQLGSGVPLNALQLTPIRISGISGISAVTAGYDHVLAVTSTGAVYSWGGGAQGQLGTGSFNDTATPRQVSISSVTAVSAGSFYSMALRSDGTVWSWGQNLYGELGNPAGATYQPTPVRVSTISGVKALSAGANVTIAATGTGAVWDWGANFYGEVGNGTVNADGTAPQWSPYQLSVAQTAPAAPRNLTAVAGDGLVYLTWAAPTAAITQYVVTPYLNGVAQNQVAAPVGSTTDTVSGLTPGGKYTFTVAAQNCLGTGTATAPTDPVIPTAQHSTLSSHKLESSRLTDRMSQQVNTFTGILSVLENDLVVKGAGLDLVVQRSYSDQAGTSSILGRNWSISGGANVSLTVLGDGSVFLNGPAGWQVGFALKPDGSYTPPSGVDSTLVRNTDGSYTLTGHGSGETWQFTSTGVATTHADRNGNTISYAYNGPGGALSAITDTQDRVTTFGYNAANLVSSITDPAGRVYGYGYDASSNLTSYTDPDNKVTRFGYDASNRLTQITTPAGRVISYGYDAGGRVTSISHPLQAGNPTTRFSYGTTSTTVTDANNHATTYTYDPVGRTTAVTDGLGNQASAAYTSDSHVASYATGNGAASGALGYDGLNNLTSSTVQPGAHATLAYGDSAHPYSPTAISDPQNNTSTVSYDANGNVDTLTTPLATQNQVQTVHDPAGLLISSTDPDGHLTSYGHDANGNLTSVTPPDPLGGTSVGHDQLSRISSVTDGKDQTTSYSYDSLDRVTRVDYADGTSVSAVYDADGNQTSLTDAAGTTTMTYDAMSRLTQRSTPDGTVVAYTYDGVGNLLTLTDPGGVTTYRYNAANLCDRITLPGGQIITLGYDAGGNRTSVAYPNGITQYSTYDGANRLVRRTVVNTATGASVLPDLPYDYTPPGPRHGSARPVVMAGAPSTFATTGTPSDTVALATPAALPVGAVEIAQISLTADATIAAAPTGWTRIREDATGWTASGLRQALYYHVATGSEPPVNTWTLSDPVQAGGGLTAWTGVDITAPVETSAGRTASTGSTWTAPSVSSQNGEQTVAFYGGRLTGAPAPLTTPTGYTLAYDTDTVEVTVGLATHTAGPLAATTGDQQVSGPAAAWVGQQVLLRPVYDTSLRQATPDGAVDYDALNRVVSAVPDLCCGLTDNYSYDGAGNRTSLDRGAQGSVTYTSNAANELTKATRQILRHGAATTASGTAVSALALPLPGGVQAHDQILATVTVSGANTVTAPGYTQVATASSGPQQPITLIGTGRGQNSAGQSTFTVTLPAGIHASDQILVAVAQTNADTVYMPGYTPVKIAVSGRQVSDATTAVYRRTATGNETKVTISGSPAAIQAAAVAVYRGVDPADPIDTVTTTGGLDTTLTYPSLTPTVIGGRLVAVQGAANNTPPGTWTAPTGMTERIQNTDQNLRSVGLADQTLTGGPTGTLTSTIATTNDAPAELAGVALTLRPSRTVRTVVLRRTATGTESSATLSLSIPATVAAVATVYRGVDPTDPVDAVTSGGATYGNGLTLDSLTPAASGERLIVIQGAVDSTGGSWQPPAGMTQRANVASTDQLVAAGLADQDWTTSDPTGTLTSTLTTDQPSVPSLAGVARIPATSRHPLRLRRQRQPHRRQHRHHPDLRQPPTAPAASPPQAAPPSP